MNLAAAKQASAVRQLEKHQKIEHELAFGTNPSA